MQDEGYNFLVGEKLHLMDFEEVWFGYRVILVFF